MKRFFLPAVLFLILFGLLTSAADAQQSSGNLVGTVADQSGALVSNAEVIVTNVDTGITTVVRSNNSGQYRAGGLLPGRYEISATAQGFATTKLQGIQIQLNLTATTNVVLPVNGTTTTVEVAEEAPITINTTTIQLQQTFEAKEISDLPMAATNGGGGVLNLSVLAPGVSSSGGIGIGQGPSIGGQRPRNNNFMIEGIDNNDKVVTGPLLTVPNDAVGEFTLITNQFSPEFGHSNGGQFNVGVRSGTNQVHGRLYEYFENRNLNAIDAKDARGVVGPVTNPRLDENRYGGQLGGPILRNKLFAFSNYERATLGQNKTTGICTPTTTGFAQLSGIAGLSPNNLAQLQKYVPASPDLPNSVCGSSTIPVAGQEVPVGALQVSAPIFRNWTYSTSSVDYDISPSDRLRARYVYNRLDGLDTAATLPVFWINTPNRNHFVNITEFHTFTPNLVNEVRVGFNRHAGITPVGNQTFPGLDSFPDLSFDDLGLEVGPDDSAPQSNIQNLYQLQDNVTWMKGKHTLVFGFDGRKYISPQTFTQRVRGDYDWSSLEGYLQDLSPNKTGERSSGNFTYYGDQTSFSGFANDVYRATSHFTVNAGLRYEFTSVPVGERQQSLNADASVPGLISFTKPEPQKTNFVPRVGFAWAPGKGDLSVRAGFSMGYDVLFDNMGTLSKPPQYSSTQDVNLNDQQPNFLAKGGLPPGADTLRTFSDFPAQRRATSAFVPNQKLPYAETYNLTIQQVFAKLYTLEIGYLGTRGIHLPVQAQLNRQAATDATHNLPIYTSLPTQAQLDNLTQNIASIQGILKKRGNPVRSYVPAYANAGFGPTDSADPNSYSTITSYQPFGASNYNALEAQLTRRFQEGLLLNVAYTWSKSMDNSTAEVFSTILTPRRPESLQGISNDYSRSALDHTHRLTAEVIYDLPFFKTNHNWAMKNLVSNWEIVPIYTYESPEYATVQSNTDSNLNGDAAPDRTIFNPNGVKGTGSGVYSLANTKGDTVAYYNPNPNAQYTTAGQGVLTSSGRNTLSLRPEDNLDLTLVKRFNITERYALELQAQAYNVLNHSQYIPGTLNDIAGSAGAPVTSAAEHNLVIPGSVVKYDPSKSLAQQPTSNALFNHPELVFQNNARTMQLVAKFNF